MSENIEKAVQTEESSETKGTDNVVLYPVSDEEKTVSAAQETSDTESKATDGKTADNTNKFNDTQNTKEASPKDAEEEDDADPGPLRQGGAGGPGQRAAVGGGRLHSQAFRQCRGTGQGRGAAPAL